MTTRDGLFSQAAAYERFMGRWSRALAPQLVRFAGVQNGDAVLDVGCGTGALANAVIGAAPTARVTGIDPSAAYVAEAQSKRGGGVRFEVGDAQRLRFDEATFDRVLSLLAVNFIPDAVKATGEMRRVTRHSGTIAAAVWDYGGGMEMLRTFWDAAVEAQPASDSKDERHMALTRPGELAALWRTAGLHDVIENALTIETRFASFDDYWVPFTQKQGPAGAHVASLAPEQHEQLRRRLHERLLGDGPDRPIALRARAWAVRGIVP